MIYGMDEDLLTLEDAARIAHVSPETIRYWIKVKRINKYPAWISKRSGKPYGARVKRGELLDSLTASKVSALESELGDTLLSPNQLAARLGIRRDLARIMVRKTGVKRYHLQNTHEFVIPFAEFMELLEQDDWYYSYWYQYKMKHRDPSHSCVYCR